MFGINIWIPNHISISAIKIGITSKIWKLCLASWKMKFEVSLEVSLEVFCMAYISLRKKTDEMRRRRETNYFETRLVR